MQLSEVAKQVAETQSAALIRPRKDAPEQYDCKPLFTGNHRGWVIIDAFTARAVNTVFDNLSEPNRTKLNALPAMRAINIVWSVLK